jgi:hypothetical protein
VTVQGVLTGEQDLVLEVFALAEEDIRRADPCSSEAWGGDEGPVSWPRTWLLRRAAEPPALWR